MKIPLQIRLCIGKLFYKSVIWITIHSNTTSVKYTWWPNGHVIRQKSQNACSAKKMLCWVTQNMMIFFLVLMVFLYMNDDSRRKQNVSLILTFLFSKYSRHVLGNFVKEEVNVLFDKEWCHLHSHFWFWSCQLLQETEFEVADLHITLGDRERHREEKMMFDSRAWGEIISKSSTHIFEVGSMIMVRVLL